MLFTPIHELQLKQTAMILGGFKPRCFADIDPEQKRLIWAYRSEYLLAGLRTELSDRSMTERAITDLYESYGTKPPFFVWGDGPRWGAERVSFMVPSLWNPLQYQMRTKLRYSLQRSWAEMLWNSLGDDLGASLFYSLKYSLRDPFRNLLRKPMRTNTRHALRYSIDGALEGYWISHYSYAMEVLCVPCKEMDLIRLRLHSEIARSTGIWWPYKDVCICTERPLLIEWDEEDPPQLTRVVYRDGLEVTGKR